MVTSNILVLILTQLQCFVNYWRAQIKDWLFLYKYFSCTSINSKFIEHYDILRHCTHFHCHTVENKILSFRARYSRDFQFNGLPLGSFVIARVGRGWFSVILIATPERTRIRNGVEGEERGRECARDWPLLDGGWRDGNTWPIPSWTLSGENIPRE